MKPFYPIPYLLVATILLIPSLDAQFGGAVRDESRAPMALREAPGGTCKISVKGSAWVGPTTVKGGQIQIRDLTGSGIRAVSGVIRFHFGGGRYSDLQWKHQSVGSPSTSIGLTPDPMTFDAQLKNPTKAETLTLGAYFGDGSICGEIGKSVKTRFEGSIESVKKDADEAVKASNSLPPAKFAQALRDGLIAGGPYARETVSSTNSMLRSKLLGPDGSLIGEYKQWLQRWQSSLRPATLSRQKRSSLQPGH